MTFFRNITFGWDNWKVDADRVESRKEKAHQVVQTLEKALRVQGVSPQDYEIEILDGGTTLEVLHTTRLDPKYDSRELEHLIHEEWSPLVQSYLEPLGADADVEKAPSRGGQARIRTLVYVEQPNWGGL